MAKIHSGFLDRQSTACLFLDIQGAFDNVVPAVLVSQLVELGIPAKVSWFVYQLISRRELQFVIDGNISDVFHSLRGVPQGSILSPLLFNLYLSRCGSTLCDGCSIVQFADDVALYARSDDLGASLRQLERSAAALSVFLGSRGLTVSPAKSALMIFSRKKLNPLNYSVIVGGVPIEPVSSYKFLGVVLDFRLTGYLHAKYLNCKCGKLANVLKLLRGVWWGSHPNTLLGIFKAMIRRVIDYASFLYPMGRGGLAEALDRTQRRALRYCAGLRQSTPINIVYAETGIGPICIRSELLARRFMVRSFSERLNVLVDKLHDLHAIIVDRGRLLQFPGRFSLYEAYCYAKNIKYKIATFTKIPLFLFSFQTSAFAPKTESAPPSIVEDISNAAVPQLVFQDYFTRIIIGRDVFFTDASKRDGFPHLGAAYFSPTLSVWGRYKLNGSFSISSGECIAIIYVMDFILERNIKKASIFTDSKSVVEVISNPRIETSTTWSLS
ncbi:unnamed protein product [Lasius platythorax]|uniref:Reverse transcriptase domain-containing protein n=1 Tax=Lasius platythorax TaxID=488582 RepID=A0AAV2MZK6_9HYME